MRTLHLCNGLGGSLWTGAILGWHSIYALDHDEWRCNRVRAQASAGWWPGLRVECADLTDWNPAAAGVDGAVDLLAAGFSCRDVSAAGRGAGITGPSTGPTWGGVLQAIEHFRPAWVFLENSPRIRTRGRSAVTAKLVESGYRWRDGRIAAADVGAPHGRDRWFCLAVRNDVADADDLRQLQPQGRIADFGGWNRNGAAQVADPAASGWEKPGAERHAAGVAGIERDDSTPSDPDLLGGRAGQRAGDEGGGRTEADASCHGAPSTADALRDRLQIAIQRRGLRAADAAAIEAAARYCGAHHWNPADPGLLPVVDGVANRGAVVAGLGDAWVPLQAAAAWRLLGGP